MFKELNFGLKTSQLTKLDDKCQNYIHVFKRKLDSSKEKFFEQNVVQLSFMVNWQSILDDGLLLMMSNFKRTRCNFEYACHEWI